MIKDGDGHDVIHDQQTTPLLRAGDLLIFGDNIAPQDLIYSRSGDGGDDLLVTIGASGQTVTIQGQFGYTSLGYNDKFAPNSRIESFAFENDGANFGIDGPPAAHDRGGDERGRRHDPRLRRR